MDYQTLVCSQDIDWRHIFKHWCQRKNLDIKPHQLEGIQWVMKRELMPEMGNPGGFICDEMGLGKTILSVSTMILHPNASKQKTLVVLPKTLLDQWCGVIEKFLGFSPIRYHGSKVKQIKSFKDCCVVVTTYGMISERKSKNDSEYTSMLWSVNWDRIIYDEAHYLRNKNTGVFKGAQKLHSPIKWMVTGTPINNSGKDFYNQCVIQGTSSCFTNKMDEIKTLIGAIVLKRTKLQVGIKIPKLTENIEEVSFESKEEEQFVRNIHNLMDFAPVNHQNVDSVIHNIGLAHGRGISWMMLMRQSCVYPEMARISLLNKARKAGLMRRSLNAGLTDSKINAVIKKVLENKNNNKRKIIFSMFHKEISEIQKRLTMENISHDTVTGATSKKQRKRALESPLSDCLKNGRWGKFKLPYDIFTHINNFLTPDVLIAQIQTCCEGLNLQHFSEIYFTTPHWNPAVEAQAIARAHRIGQKKPVNVYRFITKFTNTKLNIDDNENVREMSLDQYCLFVQKIKKEKAEKYGL
jgi:SNF2 family DNA or RNA helicase